MSAAQTVAVEGAKVGPPLAVMGAKYFGMTVDDWIQLLTVLYLLGLVLHQLPKHWQAVNSAWRWAKGKFGNANQ